MPLFLVIDGGGTKTSAVIASVSPNAPPVIVRGEAGPSNVTFGLDVCIDATTAAVTSALTALAAADPSAASSLIWPAHDGGVSVCSPDDESIPLPHVPEPGSPLHTYHAPLPDSPGHTGAPVFERVWAAYAGCARPPDRKRVLPALEGLFPGAQLRLTGDGELLTAPLRTSKLRRAVTLICGTGSLGLLWEQDGDDVTQVARAGGWGPLLADYGSGWSLGKAGIASVLAASANDIPLKPWQEGVLQHFNIRDANELITACSALDPTLAAPLADSERKKRIAGVTRIVIGGAQRGDEEALRVVGVVAGEVVENLRPLVERNGGAGLAETMLVVAGGLGQVDCMWEQVEARFKQEGWSWGEVVKLDDPAMSGIQAVLGEAGVL